MKKFLYLLTISGLLSCASEKNPIDKSHALVLPFSEVEAGEVRLSNICQPEKLIPLETAQKSLISSVDKVVTFDKNFAILDRRGAKAVMVFNDRGKFVNKIGQIGKKSGQYIMIDDFCIDKKKKIIYILANQNQVIVYDFKGNPQRNFLLSFYASNIEYNSYADRLYFVGTDETKDNLVITDNDGAVKRSYFPNAERGEHTRLKLHPFSDLDTIILYHRYLDDNIYAIKGEEVSVKYTVDFGDKQIKPGKLKELLLQKPDSLKLALRNYKHDVKYFIENSKTIEILFFYNRMPYLGVYDKRTGKGITRPFPNVKDDILNLENKPIRECLSGDNLIAIIQPSELKPTLAISNYLAMSGIDMSKITLDNNPFLWVFKR